VWERPNTLPESVTDRPTESHEYILLLTKSARYFFDADACASRAILIAPSSGSNGGRNLRSVWTFPTRAYPGSHSAVFLRNCLADPFSPARLQGLCYL